MKKPLRINFWNRRGIDFSYPVFDTNVKRRNTSTFELEEKQLEDLKHVIKVFHETMEKMMKEPKWKEYEERILRINKELKDYIDELVKNNKWQPPKDDFTCGGDI